MIESKDLAKTYGAVRALDGMTVDIPSGAVGLLGPNGAGKSTFIRALLGLVRPDKGSIFVLGMDVATNPLEVREKIGYMPEHDCLRLDMDAVDFVSYVGTLGGLSWSDARQRAHESLEYVGIGDERYRKMKTYSTGMKQKAKLASALVTDPDLLILDEPTSGMDSTGRREVLDLIADIVKTKDKNLLLSSHLLPDIERTCSNVVVMASGRVLLAGELEELKRSKRSTVDVRIAGDARDFAKVLSRSGLAAREKNNIIEVDREGDDTVDRIVAAAAKEGVSLRMASDTILSLEEVFLQTLEKQGGGGGLGGGQR